jgi:hypothetical protein
MSGLLFSLVILLAVSSIMLNKGMWTEMDKILTETLRILHRNVTIKVSDAAVDKFIYVRREINSNEMSWKDQ